mmetsp:Transcript_5825/g.6012  ORF Transcript_5825/g.6012 Transcript_5825/m.6012 type:complete len:568 (+) Transcript_5825:3-1706(+)
MYRLTKLPTLLKSQLTSPHFFTLSKFQFAVYKKNTNPVNASTVNSANKSLNEFKPSKKEKEKKTKQQEAQETEPEEPEEMKDTESFVSSINDIDSVKLGSVDGFIKNFNAKLHKQNLELTNKVYDLFNDSNKTSSNSSDHFKIFMSLNEINKVNVNNTSKLLKLFLVEILKHSKSNQEGTASSSKQGENNYSWPLFLFLLLIGYGFYSMVYTKSKQIEVAAGKVIESLTNRDKLALEYPSSQFPYFEKLNIPIKVKGSASQVTSKNLILIGGKGIGKSESLRSFTLNQVTPDNLVIYADLRKGYDWDKILSYEDLTREVLRKETPGIKNRLKLSNFNNFEMNELVKYFFTLLNNKPSLIVFDNFDYDEDHRLLPLIESYNQKNFKTIIATSHAAKLEYHLANTRFNNYQIKYLENNEVNFKRFMVDKISKHIKQQEDKTICEKFDQYNYNQFKEGVPSVDFYRLEEYVDSNSTIKNYLEKCDLSLRKSLESIRMNNPEEMEYLLRLIAGCKTSEDKSFKNVSNVDNKFLAFNAEVLDKFERLGWISVRENRFRLDEQGIVRLLGDRK